jgi:D-psicose/D-tagatose/L-ribulose 3-epimerase
VYPQETAMIKFGINTFIWATPFKTQDLHWLDKAKAMGYDLVEIPVMGGDDLDYVKAGEVYKRNGLEASVCAVMGANTDPSHEDESVQRGGVEYLKHCVDAVVKMGGTKIGGPVYSAVGRQWQATPDQRKRDLERCAKNLREVGKYAQDKGVVIGMEPLNRFETSFINVVEQAIELMKMVDSPAIQLMVDTFHMNVEEKNLGRAIELAGPYLVHVHANENDRGIPGSGHVPWLEVAAALKKVKFSGAMVIESFSAEVKEIARAAAVWRPPAPSGEILTTEGLAFLKKLMA